MSARVELRHGIYRDSVVLMQVSQAITACRGVTAAIVAMATPLNIEVYERLGFDLGLVAEASPNNLLVAIEGDDEALDSALAELERQLTPAATQEPQGLRITASAPYPRISPAARRLVGTHFGAGRIRLRRSDGRCPSRRLGDAVF